MTTLDDVQRLISVAMPRRRVSSAEPLRDGLSNTNLLVTLADPSERVVLRLYDRDPDACAKEVALLALLRHTVPVPEVLYAEPRATNEARPFGVLRYVEGITFRELKRRGDAESIAQASWSAGETLAAVGRHEFEASGWIGADLAVDATVMGDHDGLAYSIDRSLDDPVAAARLGADIVARTRDYARRWMPRLAELPAERRLVHCDFGSRNVLVHEVRGRWRVAAVIDWEFAVSATPLIDVGHFLRYEPVGRPIREPHFTRGFVDGGGALPEHWRDLGRLLDLSAQLELLTRPTLPQDIADEVAELVSRVARDDVMN